MTIVSTRIVAPVIAAAVAAAAMFLVQRGCSDGGTVAPATTPGVIVVQDSIDLDSLKATFRAELRPSVRVIRETVTVPERSVIDSVALAEARDVISNATARLDTSNTVADIVWAHDTTLTDSAKGSTYAVHQEFSFRRQEFALALRHEWISVQSGVWGIVEKYGPWAVGVAAAIKLIIDIIQKK